MTRDPSRRETLLAATVIALLTLIVYGDVLLRLDNTVISNEQGDTSLYFAPFRAFGFGELAAGNLPLWNPHVFSGAPFVGGFQSAMFYPPNLMYLFLPLPFALNLDICLHSFLLGLFTYLWARRRVDRPEPALFAAAVMMFGGPYAFRVLAGQLTMLSSLAFTPLLLLAIDKVFDTVARNRPALGPVLLGVGATSLQVLAGYPGTVFMSAFTAAAYCLTKFVVAPRRWRTILPLAAIAIWPIGITMVQLWVGLETAAESIRGGGGTFSFASSFSFPIENVVTLVSPAYFGDNVHAKYWGRWNFWDVSLFAGVAAVILVPAGLVWGRRRGAVGAAAIALLILMVSFGRYTPVYEFLYDYAPGFRSFRAPSKFAFFAMIFFALLAALGLDAVLARTRRAWALGIGWAFPLGVALVAAGAALFGARDGWADLLGSFKSNPDAYVWFELDADYVSRSLSLARTGLLIAGATGLGIAALLVASGRRGAPPRLARGLILLVAAVGAAELILFARTYHDTFELRDQDREAVNAAHAACTGGERVLDIARFDGRVRNYAVDVGGRAVWGYDPVILKRYGEFCTFAAAGLARSKTLSEHVFTWGSDPFGVALNLGFNGFAPDGLQKGWKFMSLLRPKFIVRPPVPEEYRDFVTYLTKSSGFGHTAPDWTGVSASDESVYEIPLMFPEFFLVNQYVVRPASIDTLLELGTTDINLAITAVLESEPDPAPTPVAAPAGFAVLDRSTDHMTFHVELPVSALLIVTHAYSSGWRAVPLPGTAQARYDVLPAYHTLMAIPLGAGVHEFRLEYSPAGYRYGRWISLVFTLAFAGAVTYAARTALSARRRGKTPPETRD